MKLFTPLLLIISLALSGCTSVTMVDHTFDPDFDLSQYQTFMLLPNPHPAADENAASVLGEDDLSLTAVRAVLEAKGFDFMVLGTPDFMVGVRAEMTGKPSTNIDMNPLIFTAWDGTARVPRAVGRSEMEDISASQQIKGTGEIMDSKGFLVSMRVEVYDTASGEIVWSGWASSSSLNAFRGDETKLKIVGQIMQRFPN